MSFGWGDSCPVGTLCVDRISGMPAVTVAHTGDHHYRVMLLDGRLVYRYGGELTPVKQTAPQRAPEENEDARHRAIAEAVFDINDLDHLEPITPKRRAPHPRFGS